MSIRRWIANKFVPGQTNGLSGHDLAQDYFRYGSGTTPVLSQLMMSERDKYNGYMYAAVTRRANKVISLADEHVKTKANKATTDAAKKKEEELVHPYLKVIDESTSFDNDEFWREIQTFIDVRGEYYLMAVRGKKGNVRGEVKDFKLLRPYEITVVRSADNLQVIGYVETRDGMYREIEPHMIIPMKSLNPFDRIKPFSMADAATDAQFTLKELTEHMQTTARRNRRYPGVVLFGGGEVALDAEQVANFKARMRNKSRGDEPMFAAGKAGNISWNDMQIDMRKSALDMVNETQLNALIAVTGTSKTKLGIEQSGVTRDTADIQDDLFTSDHAIPALRLILSALNQDYKNSYPKEYEQTGYKLYVKSPLGDDKETELKSVKIRTESFALYQSLRKKGYSSDVAARFADGEMELTEIGEPTEEPDPKADPEPAPKDTTPASAESNRLQQNQIAARDIPDLYDGTGIDPDDLGCIMVDVEPLDIVSLVEDAEADLVSETTRHDHQMGAVAEVEPHITLLYGLLENGNAWKDKVDAVLEGWDMDKATIEKVGFFETPDSYAVVAHIEKTDELVDGHERLTLLPHIQTFSEYQPHMTLAYIQKTADVDKWVKALGDAYNGRTVKVTGINYGDPEDDDSDNSASGLHDHLLPAIRNQQTPEDQAVIEQQEGSLRSTVINVEAQVVSTVLSRVPQLTYETREDIITEEEEAQAVATLAAALVAFYTALLPLIALAVIARRVAEFGLPGEFAVDERVTDFIEDTATKAAKSHIHTILDDIRQTISDTVERLVQDELKTITREPDQSDDDILAFARKKAWEGIGQQRIIAAIRQKFGESISKTRAQTISRTESRRAYNRAQFEADRQFLTQNDLMSRAYKKWVTRGPDPCPFCNMLAARPPIPFMQPFAKLGEVLSASFQKQDGTTSVRTMRVGFEDAIAGEIHPNGWCTYQLIIMD